MNIFAEVSSVLQRHGNLHEKGALSIHGQVIKKN